MKWRGLGLLCAFAALAVIPLEAAAKPCGDDVGGQDVPCACGDTVVSSVVLADDPVTAAACDGDGLVVRASQSTAQITIDLHGKALRGSGHGAGLLLVHGGPGGALVTSSTGTATIEGFHDGVVSDGNDAVALVENIVVRSSVRHGMRLHGGTYQVRHTEVRDSGANGYAVMGWGFRMVANRAVNSGKFGYFVMGQRGTLGVPGEGNVSEGSRLAGFSLWGMAHHLSDCTVSGSGKEGVELYGMEHEVDGCLAHDNGGSGIFGLGGMRWRLANNEARDNAGDGILIGWGAVDVGGNRGSGNRGQDQQRPVVQCQINGAPCRP
jgi:parallel beta helix pectate lyase-like protein